MELGLKKYLKDVKPLILKHTIITRKKINPVRKRESIFETTEFISEKSDLHEINRKQKRKFIVEKSIDLHGYTKDEAFNALLNFFETCQLFGVKKVLVITGGNALRETTLRKSFQIWIKENFGNYVTSCTSANIWHGGQGAFYVILKNKK